MTIRIVRAVLVVASGTLAVQTAAIAQPIDVKTVVAEAIAAEVRSCHDYMSAHPDVGKGYGHVSVDDYCACEANLLVGSVAPDEVVRLKVDGKFEAKVGERRRDTGLYCLGLLLKSEGRR